MAEFLDSLPAEPVLRTFVQYLIAFYNWPEAASDVNQTGTVVHVKLVIQGQTVLEI